MKGTIEIRTFKSSMWGLLLFFINFIQNIVLIPIVLKYWGAQKYGIWIAIFALISIIKTIDLGHQNYIGNEFNKYFYTDKEYSKSLLGSAFNICIILGFFEFFVFILFFFILNPQKLFGIPVLFNLEGDYRIGLACYVFTWSILGSLGGLLVKIILPFGLYSSMTFLTIFSKLSELFLLFFATYYNWNLNITFFYFALINLINSLITFYFIKVSASEFFPWWSTFNYKLGFRNLLKSIVFTLNAFIDQFNSSGIILIVSKTIGILFLPLFSTLRTITNVFIQITSLVTNPLVPEVIRLHSTNQKEKIIKIIDTNWFIVSILVIIPFYFTIPFIEYIFTLWLHHKINFNFPLYCLLALSVIFVNIGRMNFNYFYGINLIKPMLSITITRLFTTLFFSFCLVPYFGILSIGIALFVSELFSSFILPFVFFAKDLKINLYNMIGKIHYYGFMQIIILILLFTIKSLNWNNFYYYYILFLCIIVYLCYLQWKNLDIEIRIRLIHLSKKLIKKW